MRLALVRGLVLAVMAFFAASGLATASAAASAPPATYHAGPDRMPAATAVAAAAAVVQAARVTVGHEDTLSKIARRTCHRAGFWPELWWANRRKIRNPNAIIPGEHLAVPACRTARSRIAAAALAAIPAPAPPRPAAAAAPAAATAAAPAPAAVAASFSGAPGSFQACVISRESGGNPAAVNPASGAGGLYQFLPSTWAALGFPGLPQYASVDMQNAAFEKAYAQSGVSDWRPYDGC